MKTINKLVIACALLALAVGALAQGGGQGRRGGFGMGQMSPYALLNQKDVQSDLKLTDDQTKKLTDLQSQQREDMRSARENASASGGGGDMQAAMKKINDDYKAKFQAVLTPDQDKRLHEIYIQWRKNSAITDPEVQTALGLSDDQKAKIKTLQDQQGEANRALFEKVRNQEMSMEDARPIMQKNQQKLEDELGGVLTPDQAQKLKDMGGAPFTGTIQMGFGGRGGRGGGGGRAGGGGGIG